MIVAFYLTVYAAAAVFAAACAWRFIRYARLPFGLRWELYPVPHEEAHRAAHGGSALEESDWWTKPRRYNLVGELKAMIPEMVFLKALWDENRPLWFRSFPFHFGLYLLAGAMKLLLLTGLLTVFLANWSGTAALAPLLQVLYIACGAGGLVLALAGALALLQRRLTSADLKPYTTGGDIFNLLFFVVVLVLVGLGYLTRPAGQGGVLDLVRGLLTFDTTVALPPLLGAGLILGALLTAYIPLTHMAHFIAKWFTYHHIRWGDTPNLRGGPLEKPIGRNLELKPTWSAPHVGGDGQKTWVDIAVANPAQPEGEKK